MHLSRLEDKQKEQQMYIISLFASNFPYFLS
jgi:hypothetical protein